MRITTFLLIFGLLLGACGDPQSAPADDERSEVDAAALPDELVLTCTTNDGQRIAEDEVRPQSNGVHLVVDNQRNYDPGISFGFAGGGGGGRNAPPGRTSFVLDAQPGGLRVACYPKDPNEEPEYLNATVADPEGLYARAELDCPMGAVSAIGDFVELPEGDPDAVAVARAELEFGLKEGDELRRAGYPDARNPVFVVMRGGQVVARTTLQRGQSGWYTDGYDACHGFQN